MFFEGTRPYVEVEKFGKTYGRSFDTGASVFCVGGRAFLDTNIVS